MISKQWPKSTENRSARKSTPMNKQQALDGNEILKSASVRGKLDLHNSRDENKDMDENDIQVENLQPPPPLPSPINPLTLTEYEQLKAANIMRNNEKLRELNLPTLVTGVVDGLEKTEEKNI